MTLLRRLIFVTLAVCALAAADDAEMKALAKEYAKTLVADKSYEPKTKDAALRDVVSTLAGVSRTKPHTSNTEMLPEEYKGLSSDELKQIQTLYGKMSSVSMLISRTIPILEDTRKHGHKGTDSVSRLSKAVETLSKLEPQLRALENKFPPATEVLSTIKQLKTQVEAVLQDERNFKTNLVNTRLLEEKKKEKEAKTAIPRFVMNAQCGSGACCTKAYKFQPEGYGCQATECVTAMACLGSSEICPMGAPLEDGTACSKGRCMSGVCVHEDRLATGCTDGPCCDVAKGKLKELGSPCGISEDACVEAAALCGGDSSECRTVNKPDGALCREGGSEGECEQGVCVKIEYDDAAEKEKDDGEGRRRLAELAEKQRLKELKRKHEFAELKSLVRRFGVLLWMNTKLDNMSADRAARQYAGTATGASSPQLEAVLGKAQQQGSKAKREPDTVPNRLWETYLTHAQNATAAAEAAQDTDPAPILQSTISNSSSSTVGFVLIGVGLILIVVYFVFGGNKKKEPQVIY